MELDILIIFQPIIIFFMCAVVVHDNVQFLLRSILSYDFI